MDSLASKVTRTHQSIDGAEWSVESKEDQDQIPEPTDSIQINVGSNQKIGAESYDDGHDEDFPKDSLTYTEKVREKSRECHNHKPQPFPDPKRKRKPTNLNKHKPNKRTKSTKISSLFPKRGNRNTKRTEKHKNKMTHGKTYNKSPRRINHKATKSKTNTGTTALERSVEQTTGEGGGGLKHFYS